MTDPYRRLFDAFVAAGWNVSERAPENALSAAELWPAELRARYPNLPPALTSFLGRLDNCENADETGWFLTAADYAGTSNSTWAWNAWEKLEFETFEDDEEESAAVREFWNSYVPIFLDVRGDYAFFAVRVTEPPPRKRELLWFLRPPAEPRMGAVVYGIEEFRNVSEVAASVPEFLTRLEAALRNPDADGPLSGRI